MNIDIELSTLLPDQLNILDLEAFRNFNRSSLINHYVTILSKIYFVVITRKSVVILIKTFGRLFCFSWNRFRRIRFEMVQGWSLTKRKDALLGANEKIH